MKHVFGSLLLVAMTGTAVSQADGPLARLLGCRNLQEGQARLACFDRETALLAEEPGPAGVSLSPPPTMAAETSARSASALNPTQQFGLSRREVTQKEIAAGARGPDLEKIDARLTRFSALPGGLLMFFLDNGQVWRQLATSGDLLMKPGDGITITRGALGSFTLRTGTGRECKVKRVH